MLVWPVCLVKTIYGAIYWAGPTIFSLAGFIQFLLLRVADVRPEARPESRRPEGSVRGESRAASRRPKGIRSLTDRGTGPDAARVADGGQSVAVS